MLLRELEMMKIYNLPRAPEGDPAGGEPVVDPAAEPAAVVDPVIDPAAEPAIGDPAADPAPVHGNKGKTPWYMDRIHKETNAKNAEREARLAAERRATDAEALAQRLANPDGDPARPAVRQPAQQSEQDIEQLVEQRANLKRLDEDANDILSAGNTEFADFTNSRQILYALGATSNEFIADLIAVDKTNAHKILDKLAKDPEKTATLVSMDPRRRTAELTRLSMAEGAKPAAAAAPAAPAIPISKAPKPAAPLAPAAGAPETEGLGDDVDDATFSKNWDKKFLKRA